MASHMFLLVKRSGSCVFTVRWAYRRSAIPIAYRTTRRKKQTIRIVQTDRQIGLHLDLLRYACYLIRVRKGCLVSDVGKGV
jgi:hypothetical protein